MVIGLSLYGLQTLGPAFSGNIKKVDNMGTLSLLAPLGKSETRNRPSENLENPQGISDNDDNGFNDQTETGEYPSQGSQGIRNALDDPNQISETPGYDNMVAGSLGQEETLKPSKQGGTDQKPDTKTPSPRQPPSSNSISIAEITGVTAGTDGNSDDTSPEIYLE